MTVIFPVSLIHKRDEPKMKNNNTYENPTITTNQYTSNDDFKSCIKVSLQAFTVSSG